MLLAYTSLIQHVFVNALIAELTRLILGEEVTEFLPCRRRLLFGLIVGLFHDIHIDLPCVDPRHFPVLSNQFIGFDMS